MGVQQNIVESMALGMAYLPLSLRAETPLSVVVDPPLALRRLDELETLVVTKSAPGFDRASVVSMRQILVDVADGRFGPLKFLTFEFAHEASASSAGPAADGFHALVSEMANLILKAPVVSIASARGHMEGPDLEFALACSMLIGEDGATFSFAGDPIVEIGAYSFLAQKIGFVRAERLMERGEVLGAAQMHQLLLLKDVAERGQAEDAMEQFLRRTARRHNSCYGIYRAQRIAAPAMDESLRAAS